MDITDENDFGIIEAADEEEDQLVTEDEDQTRENEIIAHRSSQSCNDLRSRHIKKLTEKVEIKDVVKDNVLPFLPAKSLSRFKSVSKDWNNRISRPLLAHEQSYRFKDISGFFVRRTNAFVPSFITLNRDCYGVPRPELGFLPHPPNDVTVVSSCRGLLLCHVTAGDTSYYICNPVTQQWRDVPEPEYYHGSEPKIVLAFEPSILNIEAHYQIVCALPPIDQPVVLFEIYSSATRSWRCSSAACTELGGGSVITGDGYYTDGICYWETDARRVLAYDLKNDIYEIINLPREGPRNGALARIRGELSYVCAGEEHGECYVSVYGGFMEMGLRQRIDLRVGPVYGEVRRGCRVLCCVDDDAMFVLIGRMIYCCKLRDQSVEVVCDDGDGGVMEKVGYLPYVNSLVSVA